ncbi:MAG: heavy-metal-associated domain-containing protein [Eubacteriaceae bacterium]|nr:heavy-metal-associated domain-containing protein [Eubacteriaceae bacterium]
MKDYIIIFILGVILIIGTAATRKHFRNKSGCCSGGTYIENKKLDNVIGKKIVKIEGMTCDKCVARVTRMINEIDGASAKVNLRKKEAVVSYSSEISDDELTSKIENAGYTVISIS